MAVAGGLSFLLALSLAGCVDADTGDDFSENLFSDLAPVLALFGERVTMQFLSQSLGWADIIILAMAPLGIVTIIVSAIRVGGPSWLKAIIGRARENLAVAEADLMSSTSNEVCELWNGRDVVRCMGSAPVAQFICLLPESGPEEVASIKTVDLEEARHNDKYLKDVEFNIWGDFNGWRTVPKRDAEKSSGAHPLSEMIIVGNRAHKDSPAPNMSLNCHDYVWRGELRAVAVFGIFLQLGSVAYSGFATYYPTLRFQKGDSPVSSYAFPCMAVGTLVLVAGILACAHVVESSTAEERYQASEGRKARLVWLQQTKSVSDQVFDSYVVFPETDRTAITSSRRVGEQRGKHATAMGLKTVLGTGVGLIGFIVQFVGLRGLHWSASIAQLGAILTMTGFRAWVRRGIAKPPRHRRLSPGFELEWFATTLGDLDNALWLPTSEYQEKKRRDSFANSDDNDNDKWIIVTGGSPDTYEKFEPEFVAADPGWSNSGTSKAHDLMVLRKHLGRFTNWRGPAAEEAVVLARAIEVTMDSLSRLTGLFAKSLPHKITWSLRAHCGKSLAQPVHFQLRRVSESWEADEDEIEAALSMWIYSTSHKEQERLRQGHDQYARAKRSSMIPNLRLLGRNSVALQRDLQWWLPSDDAVGIIEVEEDGNGRLEVENFRIVGCAAGPQDKSRRPTDQTRYKSRELAEFRIGAAKNAISEGKDHSLLAIETYDTLKSLYAKDMYSAFLWAAAKTMNGPIGDSVEIRPRHLSGVDGWKSFTLRNSHLSRLAQEVHNTGVGSLGEIYLIIIPPLSEQRKLPPPDTIADLARQYSKPYEQQQRWKQAGDSYLWLFRVAMTFPEHTRISIRATALLMEYQRVVTLALEARETQKYNEKRHIEELRKLQSTINEELRGVDGGILSGLMDLYEEQGRAWKCDAVEEARHGGVESLGNLETFDYTELHRLAHSTNPPQHRKLRAKVWGKTDASPKDIHDWTPLHYAAAKGCTKSVSILLESRPDVNAPDILEWRPLHYACQGGSTAIVRDLIRDGAELDVRGRDWMAPLLCAAINGHVDVMRFMVEVGADRDITDASGNTPLHWAAFNGHKHVCEYLQRDMNRDLHNHDGMTALHLATLSKRTGEGARQDMLDIVRLMAAKGEIEARDRLGRTPLHHAAIIGNEAVARLLTELHADCEAESNKNLTPLLYATHNNRAEVARVLIAAGANYRGKYSNGQTLLHEAASSNSEAVARLLIELGADYEAKDQDGETPLHQAAFWKSEAVAKLLIDLGANYEARKNNGNTPLHMAAMNNSEEVARLLIEHGADQNAENDSGKQPIIYAVTSDRLSALLLGVDQ